MPYIIGKETGEYNYEMGTSIIVGTVLGLFLYLMISRWNKKRNGNVPDVDERSVLLIKGILWVYSMLFFLAVERF